MEVLIALGSNAPIAGETADATGLRALDALPSEGFELVRASALYRPPCFPAGAGPDYINAAAVLAPTGTPAGALARLHRIEAAFGRERVQRWGNRVLDLDLLAWGDAILPNLATFETWRALPADQQSTKAPETLILPHPRLQDRAFVLVPLNEIAPDWRHPVLGRTVSQLTDALPAVDLAAITRL